MAGAAIDRLVTPRPASTTASSGSLAASPQTLTGFPAARPAAAVIAMSRSSAGCHGSSSGASSPASRSAAKVYWLRSLVPMETKSTCSTIRSAHSAAAGTSIITPAIGRPWPRTRSANAAASAGTDTIGAITHRSAPVSLAASASASSWVSSSAGTRPSRRRPRTPSAGLGSARCDANASGLSAPASSVRATTLRPPIPARISA